MPILYRPPDSGSPNNRPQHTVQVRREPVGDLILTAVRYPPGTTLAPHRHEPAALIQVLEGDYHEAFQSRSFSLSRGHQLFRPANAVHSDLIGNRGASCFLIQFTPAWLENIGQYGSFCERPVMTPPVQTDRLVASIYRQWHIQDPAAELMIEGLALELSAQLIRSTDQLVTHHPPSWLRRVREYVYDQPTEEHRLQSLALTAHVHPVHLCREFRRHYGQTVGDFIRQRRVEVAAEQIALHSDEGLTDIAINSGFASHAHFSTVFRQVMGISPSQYRKNLSIRRKSVSRNTDSRHTL
jgi:AraC family transcriptional regulator